MILGHDPVAREVIVDLEDGGPQFEIPASRLVIKLYIDRDIIFAEANATQLTAGLLPRIGSCSEFKLFPVQPGEWRIQLI